MSDREEFPVLKAIDKRPEDVPSHWHVFNAYRPLYGTLRPEGGSFRWEETRGPSGIHFAAVDPDDPMAETWIRMNRSNKAVLVAYEN